MSLDLQSIEGSLPYGTYDPLQSYAQEHGFGAMGDLVRLAGLPHGDDELREIVASTRGPRTEESAYIGPLMLSACAIMERRGARFVSASDLASTALTDLFERYGADLSELRALGPFRLFATAETGDNDSVGLDYQVRQVVGRRTDSFWQVTISPRAGSVNLYTCGAITPLSGAANIALIPGVAEALSADIVTLGKAQA